jgi:CubicO group peptidase (beta-lactamase class C family)
LIDLRTARRRLGDADRWLAARRRSWDVPGMAVAVVAGPELVYAGGTGTRRLGHAGPVTSDTPFAICSCTKAFTTTLLAMLAEEGRLDWERPVRDVWPEFELFDRVAGERLTPRDLVTHRGGLPRHDYVWYGSSASRDDLVRALRHLEPTADLRTTYQYQNLMYMTAGALAGRIAGCEWEQLLRERILEPLKMTSTTAALAGLRAADGARPHESRRGRMAEVPYRSLDAVGPAGSINSTVNDMSRWLRLHLGGGAFDGTKLFTKATLRDMQRPHMSIGDGGDDEEFQLLSYGLGWTVMSYRGHRMVTHSGGIDGFRCRAMLLPDDGVGTVVLTNGDTALPHAVTWELADRLLGLDPVNWTRRLKAETRRDEEQTRRKRGEQLAGKARGTRPSRRLAAYVGTYRHPGYGRVVVSRAKKGLTASLNDIDGRLVHFHYDLFEFHSRRWTTPFLLTFATGEDGGVPSLSLPLQEGAADIRFTRSDR